MAITVAQLAAVPLLKIRPFAGAGGMDRLISWAHACELPNPWDWMGAGDLLMCNGLGIPADEGGQAAFVRQLADARLSGILIGEDQHAPPLTSAMVAAADELGFPVLFNAYEVPFVAVARAVADANSREEQSRLVQTVRVYDLVRAAAAEGSRGAELIDRLGTELRARLHVLDTETGVGLLPGHPGAGEALRTVFVQALEQRGRVVTSVLRLALDGVTVLAVPIPAAEPAMLLAEPLNGRAPALALLQHVALIAALELETLSLARETERRLGGELFGAVLDGRMDPTAAMDRAREHGFVSGSVTVLACPALSAAEDRRLHHRLAERAVPHLLLVREDVMLALLPTNPQHLDALLAELGRGRPVGVSDGLSGWGRLIDGAREARWALGAAGDQAQTVRYGEVAPLFMPRTLSEARVAVARVLGALIEYDESRGSELLRSLTVFLECNRSWQRASEALLVHKGTVVYRMRRVEELTGRSLDRIGDVSELWLALEARRQLGESSQGEI